MLLGISNAHSCRSPRLRVVHVVTKGGDMLAHPSIQELPCRSCHVTSLVPDKPAAIIFYWNVTRRNQAIPRHHGDFELLVDLVAVADRCETSAVRSEGRKVEPAVRKIC